MGQAGLPKTIVLNLFLATANKLGTKIRFFTNFSPSKIQENECSFYSDWRKFHEPAPERLSGLPLNVTDATRGMEKVNTVKVTGGKVIFTIDSQAYTSLMTN